MKKKILVLGIILAMVMAVAVPMAVIASNVGTQEASTAQSTSINIVGKVADAAVTNIYFPQGAPSATISDPYNSVDGSGDPQFLDSGSSEPVVRLKNASSGNLTVTLEITAWENGVVVAEDYELVDVGNTTVSAVSQQLSADGEAASVPTGESIDAGAYKALYLEVVLGDVGNVTGSSTLTILGET